MANWVNIMDIFYPVGSIYLSTNSTSPASVIGGSWAQVKGGCLAATGYEGYANAGEFGGTFTVSISQLPAHSHRIVSDSDGRFCGIRDIQGIAGKITTSQTGTATDYIFGAHTDGGDWGDLFMPDSCVSTGGGQAFYPRHYSMYVWKRTA